MGTDPSSPAALRPAVRATNAPPAPPAPVFALDASHVTVRKRPVVAAPPPPQAASQRVRFKRERIADCV
jgi:hypothetical protein